MIDLAKHKELIERLVVEYWLKKNNTYGKHWTEVRADELNYEHWHECLKRLKEK